MTENNQEMEVKFHLMHLPRLAERLTLAGGEIIQQRVLETNLRFDLPDRSLSQTSKALRLRQDEKAHLTFKGEAAIKDGVTCRKEVEVVVEDFENTRIILESLGYCVYAAYEKYRCTYRLGDVLVFLDEMPFGDFVEIEGRNGLQIEAMAQMLGLNWDARLFDSYLVLFDRMRAKFHLTAKNLTFDEFRFLKVDLLALGIHPAD